MTIIDAAEDEGEVMEKENKKAFAVKYNGPFTTWKKDKIDAARESGDPEILNVISNEGANLSNEIKGNTPACIMCEFPIDKEIAVRAIALLGNEGAYVVIKGPNK